MSDDGRRQLHRRRAASAASSSLSVGMILLSSFFVGVVAMVVEALTRGAGQYHGSFCGIARVEVFPMSDWALLVQPTSSLTSLFDRWFFALDGALWILVGIMAVVVIAAFVARQLTFGGAVGAFLVGFFPTWILGFGALFSLLFFFIATAILGKISKRLRKVDVEKIHQKTGSRDVVQVFANGLMALLAALLFTARQNPAYLIMFGAAVGEAASDSFASEVGILSKQQPVSILTGRPMDRGLSGAVSALGLVAALMGALLVAVVVSSSYFEVGAERFRRHRSSPDILFGCLLDSVLGITLQAHYWDEAAKRITEKPTINGRVLPLARGVRWIDNDMVNLISNISSALLALALASFLSTCFLDNLFVIYKAVGDTISDDIQNDIS